MPLRLLLLRCFCCSLAQPCRRLQHRIRLRKLRSGHLQLLSWRRLLHVQLLQLR
jgi:hypothetical protein